MATIKIMPLGDSITVGSLVPGAYRAPLWTRLKSDGLDVAFVGSQTTNPRAGMPFPQHEGHDSVTAPGLSWGFQNNNWFTAAPDIILLMIGTNDVGLGASFAQANTDLAWLLDVLIEGLPSVKILVSTLTPRADDSEGWVASYNATLPGVVASRAAHVTLVPLGSLLTLADIDAGGIHPTQTGDDKIAAGWQTAIRSLLMAVTPVPTPATVTTWNPNDRSPTMTLNPALLIATSGARGLSQSIRTTTKAPVGLWQAEIVATAITPDWAVGLGTADFPLGSGGGIGNDKFAIGFYPVQPKQSVWLDASETGVFLSAGPDNSAPDVTGSTVDIVSDGISIWFGSDAMNAAFSPPAGKFVYNNDVSADPATNKGGFSLADMAAGNRFLIANTLNSGSAFSLNVAGPFKRHVAGAVPYGAAVVTPPTDVTHVTVAAAINAAMAAVNADIMAADNVMADAEAARLKSVSDAESVYKAAIADHAVAFAAVEKKFSDAMALVLADLAKLTP